MLRRGTRPRDPQALPQLSQEEIDAVEASNGLLQFDRMFELIEEAISTGAFTLTPDLVCELQEIAVRGLESDAGKLRSDSVDIDNSDHVPPPWDQVPRHLDDMCQYINKALGQADPIHLSAYAMWRLNWIHPFGNGNGRTSRVVSYLVLCASLNQNPGGMRTIADIIDEDKSRYYAALDSADAALLRNGSVDVSAMEKVIEDALELQLTESI